MITDTAITSLLTTLYSAPLQPESWDDFLGELAPLCSVNKAALLIHHSGRNEHRVLASFGDAIRNRENIDKYESEYWRHDKWTERAPQKGRTGRILRGQEVWPEEELRKSVFYNEFLEGVDVLEVAALIAARSKDVFHALSIYRGPREAALTAEQLAPLAMIAPHLQNALIMRRQFLGLDPSSSDLETALDRLRTAVVFVDDQARPVLANQAARRVCDTPKSLNLSHDGLTASDDAENSRLTEIIARAISAGTGKTMERGGATFVSRAKKRPLQVFATPFRSQEIPAPQGAVAVVFIADRERRQRAATTA